jgi:hypothetical protein
MAAVISPSFAEVLLHMNDQDNELSTVQMMTLLRGTVDLKFTI